MSNLDHTVFHIYWFIFHNKQYTYGAT